MQVLRATVITILILFVSFSLACAAPKAKAKAQGQATKAEAKAFVERAAAYIKQYGKEKALAEFNNPKGVFIDRDLYMFAYDFNGVNLALGSNPKWVGHNFLDLDDADGTPLIRNLIAVAKTGGGWYDYKWSNPKTKKNQKKSSYVIKIDDTYFIGSGIYIDDKAGKAK